MTMSFEVTTEQLLLKFGHTMAGLNIRAFEPAEPKARIVCFHSFVGNARDFDPLAAFFAGGGVTVVSPDMYGRGESAYFSKPEHYTLRRIVPAAAAVLERYGREATVLGCGWGALIAVLGLRLAGIRPRNLVAVDLPLDFSVDSDPVITRAIRDRGITFPTADAALAHVRTSPEFAGLPPDGDLMHRVRPDGSVFRLSHDEAITQRTQVFGGRRYDLRTLFAELGTNVLMLSADETNECPTWGTVAGGLNPNGRLHLRSPLEKLVVLGFVHSLVGP